MKSPQLAAGMFVLKILGMFLSTLVVMSMVSPARAKPSRPNIVMIMADDLGWTDVSGHNTTKGNGSSYYRTPNIDTMMSQGMSFDTAYASPNCLPTRASLLSGQYSTRTKAYTVNPANRGNSLNRLMDAAVNHGYLLNSVTTVAESLKASGYNTGFFGKWHLGGTGSPGGSPTEQGYDKNILGSKSGSLPRKTPSGPRSYFPGPSGTWTDSAYPVLARPTLSRSGSYVADVITDESTVWMETVKSDSCPFFTFISHHSVHQPVQALASDVAIAGLPPLECLHHNQTYAAMVLNLDRNVGKTISYLETTPDPNNPGSNLIDNTMIVFYSDNGGLGGYATSGSPGASEITHNAPLRSGKGSAYEGGVRVPLIFRWDGKITPNTVSNELVSQVDFFPTFLDVAGSTNPVDQTLDGESLVPILEQTGTLKRDAIFLHFPAYLESAANGSTMRARPFSWIRKGHWKLIWFYENYTPVDPDSPTVVEKLAAYELYDLDADIGEKNNLISIADDTLLRELSGELNGFLHKYNADMPKFKGTTNEVPAAQAIEDNLPARREP